MRTRYEEGCDQPPDLRREGEDLLRNEDQGHSGDEAAIDADGGKERAYDKGSAHQHQKSVAAQDRGEAADVPRHRRPGPNDIHVGQSVVSSREVGVGRECAEANGRAIVQPRARFMNASYLEARGRQQLFVFRGRLEKSCASGRPDRKADRRRHRAWEPQKPQASGRGGPAQGLPQR